MLAYSWAKSSNKAYLITKFLMSHVFIMHISFATSWVQKILSQTIASQECHLQSVTNALPQGPNLAVH